MTHDGPIPFNRPFIAGRELEYISQAVQSEGTIAGDGPFTVRCQDWIAERLGSKKVLLTHSCTAALEMAAILCGIGPGDEVIMPSFTFVSTANAFVLFGAKPVFVDIHEETLNLDARQLEAALSPRTRAIVPVHYAGLACDMDPIMAFAKAHDLVVIEDAAQAFLSTYRGRSLGTIGPLGCLSFHETKNIICGEGGALLINDDRFLERAEQVRQKGTNRAQFFRGEVDRYTWVDVGSSYAPSDLVAAFLYAQLELSETIIAKRKALFLRYSERLKPLADGGQIRLPGQEAHDASNGHLYYVLTGSIEERTRLIAYLAEHQVKAVFHYVPLHSSPAGQRLARSVGPLPVTESIGERVLRLPLYYEMTLEQVDRVCALVSSFYGAAG